MEYTITTTETQEKILQWLAKQNGVGVGQFIQAQLSVLLAPQELRLRETEDQAILRGLQKADAKTRAGIITQLGVEV